MIILRLTALTRADTNADLVWQDLHFHEGEFMAKVSFRDGRITTVEAEADLLIQNSSL